MIAQSAPIDRHATTRKSADTSWPLRGADGRPFYERKQKEQNRERNHAH